MTSANRRDDPAAAPANPDDSPPSAMLQATDFFAFNRAAEQCGRPWRLSRLHRRGWALVHATAGVALEMPDARSDFEAVKRAVAFLLAEGRL